jgi:eukaryotic-like serine/threonine-protein kinase
VAVVPGESSSQKFGSYRLLTKLGRGGMGEAWRAVREGPSGIQKDVVIKRILRAYSEDPTFRDNFVNEAKLSARLSHGNIAQVFDFGEVNGEWFMALEYVNGRPLARVVDRSREKGLRALPTPVALYIAIEMLKGLAHAHTRTDDSAQPLNIVHRDISPDNVMVSFEGEVKLLDFGIAKARLAGRQETQTGMVKGKVRYFSPEQAQGQTVDARSDIWSVALVLYEMLAGRPALEGQQHVVLVKLARGEVPRIRVRAPWVPEQLADIITKALQPERNDRYPTAIAFQEALGRYLHSTAPALSQSSVAGTMAWLFDDELVFEGKSAEISASVQMLIDESTSDHALPEEEDITLSKRETVALHVTPPPRKSSEQPKVEDKKPNPLVWAAVGGAVVVVLIAVGIGLAAHVTSKNTDGAIEEVKNPWPQGMTPPKKSGDPLPDLPVAKDPPKTEPAKEDVAQADAPKEDGAKPGDAPKPDEPKADPTKPPDEKTYEDIKREQEEERLQKLALKVPAADTVDAAVKAYNDRQFETAAGLFDRAIHQGGREWLPVMMLGLCKVKLEKWEEARALLLEATGGGGKHAPAELRADAALGLAIASEALGMNKQETVNRLHQTIKTTGQVDLRLGQIRTEVRFKKFRSTPEYKEFLEWVDGLGSKRKR